MQLLPTALLLALSSFSSASPSLPEDLDVAKCSPGSPSPFFIRTIANAIKVFNPVFIQDAYSSTVASLLHSSLISFNPHSQAYEPSLAKSWSLANDNCTYTFHLRHNLSWSDGSPFSIEDVLFTLDTIFDPRYPNQYAEFLKINNTPISYKKIDPFTLQISTPYPNISFLNSISSILILPKHKLSSSVQNGSFQQQWSLATALSSPSELVGMGPFVLHKFKQSELLVLKPNPHYWRIDPAGNRLPYIQNLILKCCPDFNTELILFAAGELDVAPTYPGSGMLTKKDLLWLQNSPHYHNYTLFPRGICPALSFMWFNLKPGSNEKNQPFLPPHKLAWFSNKYFRQAIAHSINRQAIVQSLFLNDASVQNNFICDPASPWHNPNVPKYPYNPSKAKKLLLQAGFHYDSNQNLLDQHNNPVQFEILRIEGSQAGSAIAPIIKENLAAIGISVRLTALDFQTLIARTDQSFDYEAAIMGLTASYEFSSSKEVLLSKGHLHLWNPLQSSPASPWEAQIDSLFQLQDIEFDQKKRIQLIHQIESILADQLPLIYFINLNYYSLFHKKWQNIKIPPSGAFSPLWNIDEIFSN